MHILAGTFKGRRLSFPKEYRIRPTTGLVRKALFDLLAGKIPESFFLDLYAGTGLVGLEALSRGAQKVVLVESNLKVLECLKKNVELIQSSLLTREIAPRFSSPLAGEVRWGASLRGFVLYRKPVEKALSRLERNGAEFDIIFADPPYSFNEGKISGLIGRIASSKLLKPDGIFILQHQTGIEKKPDFQKGLAGLSIRVETRRYGSTSLSLMKDGAVKKKNVI